MPALVSERVCLRLGGVQILDDVTLSCQAGELIGIIGPNGAGKTSLLNVLTGTVAATSGIVRLHGHDVTRQPPHRRARRGLGRSFQTAYLFSALTVLENVRLASQARQARRRDFWRPVRDNDEMTVTAEASLTSVGLLDRAHVAAGSLAHGERRKLELAILLAGKPTVLLLDEPMAGVNADDIDELTDLIRTVHRTTASTILLVEHHIPVVVSLCDRIAVMHHGTLLACGVPRDVMADARVQSAYLGESL